MLQHDYLLEVIQRFSEAVADALDRAFVNHDREAAAEVETQVANLMQLSRETAMSLSPSSLVTMLRLSGTGESVAHHASWALARLSEAYERMGDHDLAMLRRGQADAIGGAFACSPDEAPDDLVATAQKVEADGRD